MSCEDSQITVSRRAQATTTRTVRDKHTQLLKVHRRRLVQTLVDDGAEFVNDSLHSGVCMSQKKMKKKTLIQTPKNM